MGSLPSTTDALASPIAVQRNGEKPADLNIRSIVLGDISFKTWYPSFYPEEIVGREVDRLYVCQWCFKYSKDVVPYLAHRVCQSRSASSNQRLTECTQRQCPYKDALPPGSQIYVQDVHAIHEIDGEDHQLFAQNLSLFAKLFLDNKSIFFDVNSFNYYLLVYNPLPGGISSPQVIGFFSKEKMSWDNNNLACILIFPPWQRKGLGKILMGVSYELSKREHRIGGPEKPLSELGRKGYMQFWIARVAKAVMELKNKSSLSVTELAERCSMLPEDIIATLKDMAVLAGRKRADGSVVVSKARVRDFVMRTGIGLTPPIDAEGFLEDFTPQVLENGVL